MNERDDMNLTPAERQIQDAIRGLGDVRADADFQARLRREFVSGEIAAAEPAVQLPNKAARWSWFAAPLLAAAALALFMLWGGGPDWSVRSVRGDGTIQVAGQPVAAGDTDRIADLIVPGVRIVVPDGVELELALGDVMVLGIIRDSDVTIPAEPVGGDAALVAHVGHGELLVKTGPSFPGETLQLVTAEGLTELVGTTIAINKGDGFTCVCVLEGTARIGKDRDHFDEVSAGSRKVMFADGREPMIVPIEPGHQRDLREFEARNQDLAR